MPSFHFGVVPIPYTYGSGARRNTLDVARILEAKYRPIGNFVDMRKTVIADIGARQIGMAIRGLVSGQPPNKNVLQPAMDRIQTDFRKFIITRQLDGRVKGVPTAAAQHGVNHRFKHPYARRASRPSFVDTGLYIGAFRAWFEDEGNARR
jgi:hypothetical protein